MAIRKQTNLQKLLSLLKDGQWHPGSELAYKVCDSYNHTVYEARRKGYFIDIREVSHNNFEYQMPVAYRLR